MALVIMRNRGPWNNINDNLVLYQLFIQEFRTKKIVQSISFKIAFKALKTALRFLTLLWQLRKWLLGSQNGLHSSESAFQGHKSAIITSHMPDKDWKPSDGHQNTQKSHFSPFNCNNTFPNPLMFQELGIPLSNELIPFYPDWSEKKHKDIAPQ